MIFPTFEEYLINIPKNSLLDKKVKITNLIQDFQISKNLEILNIFFQDFLFQENYKDLYQLFLFEIIIIDKNVDQEYFDLLSKLNQIFVEKGRPRINSNPTFDKFVLTWTSSVINENIKYSFLKLWFNYSGLCQWIRPNNNQYLFNINILDLINIEKDSSDIKKDFMLFCIRKFKRYEESTKHTLIFNLVEIITNPNRLNDQDWYIFKKGAFDLQRTIKIIKFIITEKDFILSNIPDSLKTFYSFNPFEKDDNGNTIFHYIFSSSEFFLEKDEINWFDAPALQIQKRKEAVLYLKKTIFFLFYDNIDNLPFIHLNDKEKNPFQIMNLKEPWYNILIEKAIQTRDQYLLDNCLTAVPEYKSFLNQSSLKKIDNFLKYVETRNTLLFGKVKNKIVPLIPNDVYKFIMNKMI